MTGQDEAATLTVRVWRDGADNDYIDRIARLLRKELSSSEFKVSVPSHATQEYGAKGGSADAISNLVVTLANSSTLDSLLQVFLNWLGRDRHRKLHLSFDGVTLELETPTDSQQQELVDAFLAIVKSKLPE